MAKISSIFGFNSQRDLHSCRFIACWWISGIFDDSRSQFTALECKIHGKMKAGRGPIRFIIYFITASFFLDKSALLTHSLTHVFSGERHRLPSRPRHAGHRWLGRPLQFLGQGRPHQAEDLGAAGPANHCLLFQPQRQHLCVRLQLRLVKGTRRRARVDLKCL